jgi:hypothetical protein
MTGYESKKAAAQDKLEPPASRAYAVIEMRVGDVKTRYCLTQEQLHDAIDPWLLVEVGAERCIKDLKEHIND